MEYSPLYCIIYKICYALSLNYTEFSLSICNIAWHYITLHCTVLTSITVFFRQRSESCNYPFKGGKDNLWEGGVRGVAFVYSSLITNKPRVSYDLIDVTDWLPTFYHLAGGDVQTLSGNNIDGMNVWDTIAHGTPSPRSEVNFLRHIHMYNMNIKKLRG